MSRVEVITKPKELKRDEPFVVMFVASFHEACQPGGQMDQVFNTLAAKTPNLRFYKVDAEEVSDLVEEFSVEVVPTFCFVLPGKPAAVERVEGAVLSKITEKLEQFKKTVAAGKPSADSTAMVRQRIDKLVNSSYVFLFMKGQPENPKCKFSKKVMELLKNAKVVNFASFDVLSDGTIRAGVKEYSNWPTFPQLFVGSKLVGGVDILEDMGSEDLFEVCQPPQPKTPSSTTAATPKETLNDKLTRLVNQAPVMVFIKGVPENPQCGFSAQIVKLLRRDNVQFSSFDILTDESVRQGLKTFSDWPTFPQLYVHGKLIGGLDVAKELAEEEGGLGALL